MFCLLEQTFFLLLHQNCSYNAVSTEDSPIGADIDRNDSAKLNSRNVIAKFASPDRLLNKMKEKKVGVAAKMYSEKAKTNNETLFFIYSLYWIALFITKINISLRPIRSIWLSCDKVSLV
jgi:hypothetical protein